MRRSVTNALGQLIRVDEPNAAGQLGDASSPTQATYYTYDTLNNLTTVNQGVQTRTFAYNSLSRLVSAQNPESGTINYVYDANGNLTSKVDARTITTAYTYDALNRVLTRAYTGETGSTTPNVSYLYDNLPNAKGRLTKVSSSVSTTEYTAFDILGRVLASKQTTAGGDPLGYATGYTYNLSGALIEETYPSGRKVKNVLDANGDLSKVESKRSAADFFQTYAGSFVYTAAGAVSSMRLGNGKFENTEFNSRLQPIQIGLGSATSTQNVLKLNYEYGTTDNNGNVKSQTITVPGLANPFVQSYSYDSLNRLQSATETNNGSQTWKQAFTFDRYGNRNFDEANTTTLPKECNGNTEVCEAVRPIVNPSVDITNNRLNGYTFDASGNTVRDAENRRFTYDAENKQVKVETVDGSGNPIATVGEYFYDGDGRRIKKIVPSTGELTIFSYDVGGKLVAEYSTTIASSQDAKVAYLTTDHLGSPRINTDQYGTVIARHDYHPFGEEIDAGIGSRSSALNYGTNDNIRQKFTGYERDDETGLDFAQNRTFSSVVGRFTSPDNFLNDTTQTDPASWNLYVYVRNNPLNFTDPTGELIMAGKNLSDKDRKALLERLNYTYGCANCVSIDKNGYLQVDTSSLSADVQKATQYITDAINAKASDFFAAILIKNGNSHIAFGSAGQGTDPKTGKVYNVIALDFDDYKNLEGDEELKKAFEFTTFAHELAHIYPKKKDDPDGDYAKERGPVVNAVNEILHATGRPLRANYFVDAAAEYQRIVHFGSAKMSKQNKVVKGKDGIEVKTDKDKFIWWNSNLIRGIN